jgi:hypothetical protein
MADLADIRRDYRQNPTPFSTHAARAMLHHRILSTEVDEALESADAEVIEDYPTDPRGPSCLVYGETAGGRIVHLVMSANGGWVITVYPPAETESSTWTTDFRRRRRV